MNLKRTRDVETVAVLNNQIFPDEPLGYELENSTWWLMKHDGKAVGFCGVRDTNTNEGAWFLSRAGLLPSVRGKGLQKRMIRVRETWARKHGAVWLVTYTILDNPASSNNLARRGFKLYTPAHNWAGEHTLYWYKTL